MKGVDDIFGHALSKCKLHELIMSDCDIKDENG